MRRAHAHHGNYAAIAQLVERIHGKDEVSGSSPDRGSIFYCYYFYMSITLRKSISPCVALVIALVWTYLSRDMYNYNYGFAEIAGVSLYPIIGWFVALTIACAVMDRILKKVVIPQVVGRFIFVIVMYSVALIAVETIGYHVFGVQNQQTSQYAGLPLCNCIHAPVWMQTMYFVLGPLHWLLVTLVRHAAKE